MYLRRWIARKHWMPQKAARLLPNIEDEGPACDGTHGGHPSFLQASWLCCNHDHSSARNAFPTAIRRAQLQLNRMEETPISTPMACCHFSISIVAKNVPIDYNDE